MTERTYRATLTPCRSNPRRYVRYVTYRRDGDRVTPFLVTVDPVLKIDVLRWQQIRESAADPEFAEMWAEHVRYQHALARETAPQA